MAVTTIESYGDTSAYAQSRARRVALEDRIFYILTVISAVLVVAMLVGVLILLFAGAWPALEKFGAGFIVGDRWSTKTETFGALVPIYGTLVTSAIAMVIGIPISFGIAIFLTELCPQSLRRPIGTAIELLAGIPSIIYGLWGVIFLVPLMANTVQPALAYVLGGIPVIGALFTNTSIGQNLFTASLVLAIMVLPFITSITRDVFLTVPALLRESAYGMGMTTWEVVRYIVIPYCRVGLVGGIMLGLGRALGETMAVTFVIGNGLNINASLFAPATTISAKIATLFNETIQGDLQRSSLLALGLLLSILSFAVLGLAKWLLVRGEIK
jgi:phosphate transport system permease protein